MPPKKRALEQSDSNAQPKRGSKQQKRGKAAQDAENVDETADKSKSDHEKLHEELEKKKPEEYIDFESEHGRLSEKKRIDEYNQKVTPPNKKWPKPPSEHPDHKWTMIWESWKMYVDYGRRTSYTNPDYFDMYIYNDFHAYGVIELLETGLDDFNKEWSKKDGSVQHMWAVMAALGHWMYHDDMGGDVCSTIMSADDGERVCELFGLFGCAFLAVLETIDRAGKLSKNSEFLDLGLVMSIYLSWSHGLPAYGIEGKGVLDWRKSVAAYAKNSDIDLKATGCHSAVKTLTEFKAVKPPKDSTKADQWGWQKKMKKYVQSYGILGDNNRHPKIGGTGFDITKWTSEERAEQAFDKVDPLADIPAHALQENLLELA